MSSLSPFSVSPQPSATDTPAVYSGVPASVLAANVTSVAFNKPKQKPRKRINTAEKRHQHNAVERQRRETLNTKFIDLARLLPALAAYRRPSKSAIVNGSITHLKYQRNQRLLAAQLLRGMATERDILLAELNEWRKASGYEPRAAAPSWTDEMAEVCNVEKETFGTFTNVGGDDGEEDDNDGETDGYSAPSLTSFATGSQHGLITPRTSTDMDTPTQPQAFFGNMPVPVARGSAASSLGPNWPNEYAYNVPQAQNPASAFPYNPYMSDSVDPSATGSPPTGPAFTPSMHTEATQHTPSPRSSGSMHVPVEDIKPHVMHQQQLPWNSAQMYAAQQHQAMFHHQQQQQQQYLHHPQAFAAPYTPPVGVHDPAYSHQLMANALANGGMTIAMPAPEHIDQWRRTAQGAPTSAGQSSSHSLYDMGNEARAGIDMRVWSNTSPERAVEGF